MALSTEYHGRSSPELKTNLIESWAGESRHYFKMSPVLEMQVRSAQSSLSGQGFVPQPQMPASITRVETKALLHYNTTESPQALFIQEEEMILAYSLNLKSHSLGTGNPFLESEFSNVWSGPLKFLCTVLKCKRLGGKRCFKALVSTLVRSLRLVCCTPVLVSQGYRKKLPKTAWLKPTEVYSLTVVEHRSPKSRCWQLVLSGN